MYLSRWNQILRHVPGTKIGKANRLSKWLDWKVRVEKNNKNQIFIKNYWLCSLSEVLIEELEVEILEKKIAKSKNKEIIRVVEKIKKTGVKVLRGEEWQIEGDLVLKKGKVYVLKNEALRVEIIWLHYNVLVIEYRGK